MTEGQRLAIEQFEEVVARSAGLLELLSIEQAGRDDSFAVIIVSVYCGNMRRVAGGLPLRDRERICVVLAPQYPFEPPQVRVDHSRWAGYPHVQWVHHPCLYRSPQTEWNASDGIFGFIDRLDDWLRQGALNELDPAGEPVHPPVAYPVRVCGMVIPRVDTPDLGSAHWLGFGNLNQVSSHRVDIVGWSKLDDPLPPRPVAAAILLADPTPFEFPTNVGDLIQLFVAQHIPCRRFLSLLGLAVRVNSNDEPLYVVVGTPMRGIRGGAAHQHLACWYVEPAVTLALSAIMEKYSSDERRRQCGDAVERSFMKWAEKAATAWCMVREDRPEVTTRRDSTTPMAWFAGKTVAIWGCGALGSPIAAWLTRAGVGKLVLRDHDTVSPGVIVRQLYTDGDIGAAKSMAPARHLKQIRPAIEVEHHHADLLTSILAAEDWTDNADLVIDATANDLVSEKLELVRRRCERCVPVTAMVAGHRAEFGLVVLARSSHSGGPADVSRRAKLAACNRGDLIDYANEFWPKPPRSNAFQPEPGCSDVTFEGSATDMAALAALMLNEAVARLGNPDESTASATFIRQPHTTSSECGRSHAYLTWGPGLVSEDPQSDYDVRIAEPAWWEIRAWINQSRRLRGPNVETGGLLFGQRDDAARVIWVDEVTGPPADSEAAETRFVCGTAGTQESNAEKASRSRGTTAYIGMWHTHPETHPLPSRADLDSMSLLLRSVDPAPSRTLMMIVGGSEEEPTVGTFLFRASDFEVGERPGTRLCSVSGARLARPEHRVGLALSGGGSRAIAFHLGCLRALHDRGVLGKVQIVSSVSGGAVIAAMYAYSNSSFDVFDQEVVALLRKGVVASIALHAFLTRRLAQSMGTIVVAGGVAALITVARPVFKLSSRLPGCRKLATLAEVIRSPAQRWVSRTTAFEDALRSRLFGNVKVADPRRGGLDVIFNACELRTGTAFRFSNRESRCWRLGSVKDNRVDVAEAVAASAAFPLLLPAISRTYTFIDRNGREENKRALLTDGGVYDNLGVTALEPGGSPDRYYNVDPPDYIIACDAGAGQFVEADRMNWWPMRMTQSFLSVYRKAQDSTRSRLHALSEEGRLKGFVLAYLGQQDDKFLSVNPGMVTREKVMRYPTNFSPMKAADIELLAGRGEQLTRLLIDRYCPDL